MNCHTSGGRSFNSWVIFQSSIIAHSCSVGPSMKACSSGVSLGSGKDSRRFQSGLPENRSRSHHTVPALMASCSVWDIAGVIFLNTPNTGPVNTARRSGGRLRTAATTAKTAQAAGGSGQWKINWSAASQAASPTVQARTGARKYASAPSSTTRTTADIILFYPRVDPSIPAATARDAAAIGTSCPALRNQPSMGATRPAMTKGTRYLTIMSGSRALTI